MMPYTLGSLGGKKPTRKPKATTKKGAASPRTLGSLGK